MSELEEKLGSILQNPQMMQQIMGMAQALSSGQGAQEAPKEPPNPPSPPSAPSIPSTSSIPQIDPALLQQLTGIARQGGIDQHQQGLLKALQPYLSRDRITKLERAMGAARMASAASSFLNSGGLRLLTGR